MTTRFPVFYLLARKGVDGAVPGDGNSLLVDGQPQEIGVCDLLVAPDFTRKPFH